MAETLMNAEENGEGLMLNIGNFCFRYRAISVVPVILITYIVFPR